MTQQEIIMDQAFASVLPLFAPLPGPIVQHLLLGRRRRHYIAAPPILVSDFEQETGYAQAEWDQLLQEVRVARQDVYTYMDAFIQRNALSTSWLLRALKDATPGSKEEPKEAREEISQSTLEEWKDRGLISYRGRNQPDIHQVAALLIARLVDRRVRNWLPTKMTLDEARSWCWRQDAPNLATVPCPLPLPEDLPKATLLVTPWAGQAWDPPWRRINSMGAAQWAGIREENGQVRWDITLEEIHLWYPQLATLDMLHLEVVTDILHGLADIALIHLAFIPLNSQSVYPQHMMHRIATDQLISFDERLTKISSRDILRDMNIERNLHNQEPKHEQEASQVSSKQAIPSELPLESNAPQLEPQELTDPRQMRALAHPIRIALIEALSLEGPLTATRAGELIGESSTTCSFHLRQLAKYGFVEEAGHGPGRERPWCLTHVGFRFGDFHGNPENALSVRTLERVLRERYLARLQKGLESRHDYPWKWQKITGMSEYIVYITPDELGTINQDLEAVLMRYRERLTDPSQRPPNALPIEILTFLYPLRPSPSGGE